MSCDPEHPPADPVLSVVVPLLNEEAVLKQSYVALRRELEAVGEPYEIIFVDDGSTDGSRAVLRTLTAVDPRVRVLVLSRNFGHEMATTAGLHHARGQAAVVIDADLQDPPELIHEFVAKWREGYQVVYGVRTAREGETLPKRVTAFLFYRLMRFLSDVPIPADTGDFRLMDRRVLDVFRGLKDDPRFFRGLIPWIGFKQIGVPFVRRPRAGGVSKYRPARLFRLAYDTITSFSTYTAHLASLFGLVLAAASVGVVGVVGLLAAVGVVSVPGWAWAAAGFLVLWNVQFLLLTMLGEYIVRTHRMSQGRPLYVIDHEMHGGSPVVPAVEHAESFA
jgi:glycosyltransferase involved in cell wall biosynthesis